jgi:uncharacterized protein (UPF0335 family)
MNKPLKFDDAKIHEQEPMKIANAGDVKKFVDKLLRLEEQLDQHKVDMKQAYDDAHEQGIDRKALKIVVKHKKKAVSAELRQEVNDLFEKCGDPLMFAFV